MLVNTQIPSKQLPVFIIGAGGIVNTAHLPAYKIAGFNVQGLFDIDNSKAKTTADKFNIPYVFRSMEEMLSDIPADAVFDIAVPGSQTISILEQLPPHSAVLLQKPMGENYEEAKKILELVRQKKMIAGINFQLRYAPYILAAKDLINQDLLGELNDIEINVNVYSPCLFCDFLFTSPRLEILYNSIH
jgi:predicted dehydrogenase